MDPQRLHELYRSTVLEHHRHPRGNRVPPVFSAKAYGKNPVCGDEVTLYLTPLSSEGWEVCWEGEGCALCRASASILAEVSHGTTDPLALAGLTLGQLESVLETKENVLDEPGLVQALRLSLAAAPARKSCALLPWKVLAQAAGQLPKV